MITEINLKIMKGDMRKERKIDQENYEDIYLDLDKQDK